MEIYFNELSYSDGEVFIDYFSIERMSELYKELKKNDIRICRIDGETYSRLIEDASKLPYGSSNAINFLYSFLRKPYESEEVEELQDEYLGHAWVFDGKDCIGLALAHIMESMSLSIINDSWKQSLINIKCDDQYISVRNLYDKETLEQHREWLESLREVQLIVSDKEPSDKRIHLRDDHGKDILMEFSRKLVKNNYVEEIINSLPFNPGDARFIRKICGNGVINIVLPWTDQGYGLAVKTTGRTMRETEDIARILQEQYGYR